MRGENSPQDILVSYRTLESPMSSDQEVRPIVHQFPKELVPKIDVMCSRVDRPSIPSEQLISTTLLQVECTIRAERQQVARLDYDLMFWSFVGLGMDDIAWNRPTFSNSRNRWMMHEIYALSLDAIKNRAYAKNLMISKYSIRSFGISMLVLPMMPRVIVFTV